MASCSGESVEAVERRKGFWWTREDTLLLISQYREHEKLFRNVNCKKKSVWELITASMAAEYGLRFSLLKLLSDQKIG